MTKALVADLSELGAKPVESLSLDNPIILFFGTQKLATHHPECPHGVHFDWYKHHRRRDLIWGPQPCPECVREASQKYRQRIQRLIRKIEWSANDELREDLLAATLEKLSSPNVLHALRQIERTERAQKKIGAYLAITIRTCLSDLHEAETVVVKCNSCQQYWTGSEQRIKAQHKQCPALEPGVRPTFDVRLFETSESQIASANTDTKRQYDGGEDDDADETLSEALSDDKALGIWRWTDEPNDWHFLEHELFQARETLRQALVAGIFSQAELSVFIEVLASGFNANVGLRFGWSRATLQRRYKKILQKLQPWAARQDWRDIPVWSNRRQSDGRVLSPLQLEWLQGWNQSDSRTRGNCGEGPPRCPHGVYDPNGAGEHCSVCQSGPVRESSPDCAPTVKHISLSDDERAAIAEVKVSTWGKKSNKERQAGSKYVPPELPVHGPSPQPSMADAMGLDFTLCPHSDLPDGGFCATCKGLIVTGRRYLRRGDLSTVAVGYETEVFH